MMYFIYRFLYILRSTLSIYIYLSIYISIYLYQSIYLSIYPSQPNPTIYHHMDMVRVQQVLIGELAVCLFRLLCLYCLLCMPVIICPPFPPPPSPRPCLLAFFFCLALLFFSFLFFSFLFFSLPGLLIWSGIYICLVLVLVLVLREREGETRLDHYMHTAYVPVYRVLYVLRNIYPETTRYILYIL